ncbi:ComF family protein [bacterium]|nr:ComF family protein [bacterium]MBP9807579.1 ComF family protein [bacterium]
MVNKAWQSICSIALYIEAHLVLLLGTRPCLLCQGAIAPPPFSFKPIYQSRFLCQGCIAGLTPTKPIMVTLNLTKDATVEIHCISICPYKDLARQAIRAFKYQDKQELAGDLAKALEGGLGSLLQHHEESEEAPRAKANPSIIERPSTRESQGKAAKSNVVLIAVPLHQTKLEERGFNQSELIAQALSKRSGIKCDTRALVRSKVTSPQYGLTKSERAINVDSAFRASDRVKGKDIILIDDVLTSGATALACAQALLKAGAQSVAVLTVARALLRSNGLHSEQIDTNKSEANSILTT